MNDSSYVLGLNHFNLDSIFFFVCLFVVAVAEESAFTRTINGIVDPGQQTRQPRLLS